MERSFSPLDRGFNAAVRRMASIVLPAGFIPCEDAPSTLPELIAAWSKRDYRVYCGHSGQTIFDCPDTNHCFRAWHDWTHYTYRLPFTRQGEIDTCEQQIRDLEKVYGQSPQTDRWAEILRAEVIGQLQYADNHNGEFPTDQKAFVTAYLRGERIVSPVHCNF